jgi:hypothetical protein
MSSTLSDMIKRHPLPAFFVLAYALSWCAVPWVGPTLAPWGPALAAVIVLAMTEGKAGLKDLVSQMGRWRVGFTWYAVALSIPIICGLSAVGLNLVFGAAMGQLDPWNGLLLLIPLFFLLGGMGGARLDGLCLAPTAGRAISGGRQPYYLHTSTGLAPSAFFLRGNHLGRFSVHHRHAIRRDLAL